MSVIFIEMGKGVVSQSTTSDQFLLLHNSSWYEYLLSLAYLISFLLIHWLWRWGRSYNVGFAMIHRLQSQQSNSKRRLLTQQSSMDSKFIDADKIIYKRYTINNILLTWGREVLRLILLYETLNSVDLLNMSSTAKLKIIFFDLQIISMQNLYLLLLHKL